MRRGMILAWLLAVLGAMPSFAQEAALPAAPLPGSPVCHLGSIREIVPDSPAEASTCDEVDPVEALPWQTAWGLVGLRVIPSGLKVAPNGGEYHPNFSLDLNFNIWLWRTQGIYMFSDMRLWGQKSEYGVTNGDDHWYGTSKREFDLSGGAAWNYAGSWEARAFGYTQNNLNRGTSLVNPVGFTDGFGLENRYYLSPEYAKLGHTGFDVARATFLSVGYYPSKNMIGNDGRPFAPGMLLRAYLIQDLWDWPCYAFCDASYLSERSFQPKLLLFDAGLAIRPFHCCRQCEFRLGAENTVDVDVHKDLSLWYLAVRYIY